MRASEELLFSFNTRSYRLKLLEVDSGSGARDAKGGVWSSPGAQEAGGRWWSSSPGEDEGAVESDGFLHDHLVAITG